MNNITREISVITSRDGKHNIKPGRLANTGYMEFDRRTQPGFKATTANSIWQNAINTSGSVPATHITTLVNAGDLLTSDGANNIALPVTVDGQILSYNGNVEWSTSSVEHEEYISNPTIPLSTIGISILNPTSKGQVFTLPAGSNGNIKTIQLQAYNYPTYVDLPSGQVRLDINNPVRKFMFDASNNQWTQINTRNDNNSFSSRQKIKLSCNTRPRSAFGMAVAISRDESTLVIAGPGDNNGYDIPDGRPVGALWVYIKFENKWVEQAKIIGPDSILYTRISTNESIAISGDGNRIVLGSPDSVDGKGCIFMWQRIGTVWVEGNMFVFPEPNIPTSGFGTSVAISYDGVLFAVGEPRSNSEAGRVFIFTINADYIIGGYNVIAPNIVLFGSSVALGNRIIDGTPTNILAVGTPGYVQVYTAPNHVVIDLQYTLPTGTNEQGISLSCSTDGLVLGVGCQDGTAIVHTFNTTWTSEIITSDISSNISMNVNGNLFIVGTPQGAAVFERKTTGWIRQTSLTYGTNNGYGTAVSIGQTSTLVGAPRHNMHEGLAQINTTILYPTSVLGSGKFGSKCVVSADGNICLIGEPRTILGVVGEVCSYMKIKDEWILIQKLYANKYPTPTQQYFGYSIDMSADGKMCIIGAPGSGDITGVPEGDGGGAAYIFVRDDRSWTKVAVLLPEPDFDHPNIGFKNSQFGSSVVMSANGKVVWVGAPDAVDDGFMTGAVVGFEYNTQWTQFAIHVGHADNCKFGSTLSMSADSSILVVGEPNGSAGTGAVYVYPDFEPEFELNLPWGIIVASFGTYVNITSDGLRIFVSAPGITDSGIYEYAKRRGGWFYIQEIKPIAQSPYNLTTISTSSNGNTLIIGTDITRNPATVWVGGYWIFTYSGNTWIQESPQMIFGDYIGADPQQGYSVDITSSGNTTIIGGINDNNKGAAWIFV